MLFRLKTKTLYELYWIKHCLVQKYDRANITILSCYIIMLLKRRMYKINWPTNLSFPIFKSSSEFDDDIYVISM